jgi:hypothetical protein
MEYRIRGNEQNLDPILTEGMYMETQVATATDGESVLNRN